MPSEAEQKVTKQNATAGSAGQSPDNERKSIAGALIGITDSLSTLVREEIALAKAEVTESITSLIKGAVVGIVGGIFAVLAGLFALHTIALLISDALDQFWAGYAIVTLALLLLGAVAALLAWRWLKKGSKVAPSRAIEQAKITEAAVAAEVKS